MAFRAKLLAHFPILADAGSPEFDHIVAHAEIDIVDRAHQKTMGRFYLAGKKTPLDGAVGYNPAKHDARLFIYFPRYKDILNKLHGGFYQFLGKGCSRL